MKVIWRELYNEFAVEEMTKLGTLPRNETKIDWEPTDGLDGTDIAAEVALIANQKKLRSVPQRRRDRYPGATGMGWNVQHRSRLRADVYGLCAGLKRGL